MAPKRVVGIVGGMGPLATADLFMKIVNGTPAKKDQDHARIVIDNDPEIPDRTAYITSGGEDPRPALLRAARNVEAMGASFIAIPCNTAHYFHGAVKEAVKIPVLHIMDEVARTLEGKIEKAGLLATTATVNVGLYDSSLKKASIDVIAPKGPDQDQVMQAIYSVKSGDLTRGKELLLPIAKKLIDQGAQAIIGGCTEIPLVLSGNDLPVPVIDSTGILAQACIREAFSAEGRS